MYGVHLLCDCSNKYTNKYMLWLIYYEHTSSTLVDELYSFWYSEILNRISSQKLTSILMNARRINYAIYCDVIHKCVRNYLILGWYLTPPKIIELNCKEPLKQEKKMFFPPHDLVPLSSYMALRYIQYNTIQLIDWSGGRGSPPGSVGGGGGVSGSKF